MQPAQHPAHHPDVLLLHGMFGRSDDWRICGAHLARHWRVIAPELPILEQPHWKTGVHGLVIHIETLLVEQRVERVVIGGNSLGGHIALSLALRQPDRVAALVLAGSSGLFERGFDKTVPRRPTKEWIREQIHDVFFDQMHVTEVLINEIHDTLSDIRKTLKLVRMAKSAKHENLRAILHTLKCPVLLVWGANDGITPPVIAHEFKEHIPHAELHFIQDCGHAPIIERPQEFNVIVEQFLKQHFGYAYPRPQAVACD